MTEDKQDDGTDKDMMSRVVNYVFAEVPERYMQMLAKKGFKVFGERAVVALLSTLIQ